MNEQRKGLLKTLGLIMALMVGLVLISFPGVRKMADENNSRICVQNMALIELAKASYALENHLFDGDDCSMEDLLARGDVLKEAPICPKGGVYAAGALGVPPTCSIGLPHTLPVKRGEAVDEHEDLIK